MGSTGRDLAQREIDVTDGSYMERWTDRQKALMLRTVAEGATGEELHLFLAQAAQLNLNPLTREIWCIKTRGKNGGEGRIAIIIGEQGRLKIASRYEDSRGYRSGVVCENDRFRVMPEPKPLLGVDGCFTYVEHSFGNPDERGGILGGWCFRAGTLVDTPAGLERIENLAPGDWVLSHTGTPRQVEANMARLPEKCIRVIAQGVASVVTEEHPYLACREGKVGWVPAGDLRVGDELCLPPRRVEAKDVSPEYAYAVGRYLGDGWISVQRRPQRSDRDRAFVCCAHDEAGELAAALGAADMRGAESARRTVTQFEMIGGTTVTSGLRKFGTSAASKRVALEAFGWSVSARESLLRGYADADGFAYNRMRGSGLGVKANTVSRELAYGLTRLARGLGYSTTLVEAKRDTTAVIEGRIVQQSPDYYTFSWCPLGNRSGIRFDAEGVAWTAVRDVRVVSGEPVYNLTVADEHTFVADGVAVHNCEVYRAGRPPVFFYAPLTEYAPDPEKISERARDFSPWFKQESRMIEKCAISTAHRIAYNLAGVYGEEEMTHMRKQGDEQATVEDQIEWGDADDVADRMRSLVAAANNAKPGSYPAARVRLLLAGLTDDERITLAAQEVIPFIHAHGGTVPEAGEVVVDESEISYEAEAEQEVEEEAVVAAESSEGDSQSRLAGL